VYAFRVHPAAISVTDGVQHAWDYLTQSWRLWGWVVLALAVANGLFMLLVADVVREGLFNVDERTNQIVWVADAGSRAAQLVLVSLVIAAVSAVASWAFTGIAIAGLRGWKLTLGVVLGRGILVFVSQLIVGFVASVAAVSLVILIVAVPALGLLAILPAVIIAIYALVRVAFAALAIFDGFGPIAGLQESWRLSEGAVLRMIGWALMAMLITMAFGIAAGMVTLPLAGSDRISMVLSSSVSGAVSGVGQAFSVFMMAALYESQRARRDPGLFPSPPYPYPAAPTWPGAYPPPGAYPYPAAPTWPGAYPPPGAYPSPGTYPPAYPPAPNAGPTWVAGGGEGTGQTEAGQPPQAPPSWPPQSS
jgi:hypothetical protein